MLDAVNRLRQELAAVAVRATNTLSGIGVIVHDGIHPLPVFPLRKTPPPAFYPPLSDYLLDLCDESSAFHDGFHVFDSQFRLVAAAQYFSPPISYAASINYTKPFGGRYIAALFGSMLPGVLATGVLSHNYGVVVFQQGAEV